MDGERRLYFLFGVEAANKLFCAKAMDHGSLLRQRRHGGGARRRFIVRGASTSRAISVIGFDDHPDSGCRISRAPLTTVREPSPGRSRRAGAHRCRDQAAERRATRRCTTYLSTPDRSRRLRWQRPPLDSRRVLDERKRRTSIGEWRPGPRKRGCRIRTPNNDQIDTAQRSGRAVMIAGTIDLGRLACRTDRIPPQFAGCDRCPGAGAARRVTAGPRAGRCGDPDDQTRHQQRDARSSSPASARGLQASINIKRNETSYRRGGLGRGHRQAAGRLDRRIDRPPPRPRGPARQRPRPGASRSAAWRRTSPPPLLNGRQQASSGDNRAVEFDQYPSELLSGVVIYKTPDAESPAWACRAPPTCAPSAR